MRNTTRRAHSLGALALSVLTLTVGACADDAANKAMKDAGVNVKSGGLPAGYPKEVPAPELPIETGANTQGMIALRLTSKDPVADITAYKALLEKAGFKVDPISDALGSAAKNVVLNATGSGYRVLASAFAKDAPGGGGYMAVSVQKQ